MSKLKRKFKKPEDLAETSFKDYYKVFKQATKELKDGANNEEVEEVDFFYVGEFNFKSELENQDSVAPLFWLGSLTPYWKKLITSQLVKRKDFALGKAIKKSDQLKLVIERGKGGKALVLKKINKKLFKKLPFDAIIDTGKNQQEDTETGYSGMTQKESEGIDKGELISDKGAITGASKGIFGRILIEEKLYNKTGNNFEESLAKLKNLQILIAEWRTIDNVEQMRPEERRHIEKLEKKIKKFLVIKKGALKDRQYRNILRDWQTIEAEFKQDCGVLFNQLYEQLDTSESGIAILPLEPYPTDTLYEAYLSLDMLLVECKKWIKKNKKGEQDDRWNDIRRIVDGCKNVIDIIKPTLKARNEEVKPYEPSQEFVPKGKSITTEDLDELDSNTQLSDLQSPEDLLDTTNLGIKLPKIFKEVNKDFANIQDAFEAYKTLNKDDLEAKQHHLFELTKVALYWEENAYKPFKVKCTNLFSQTLEEQVLEVFKNKLKEDENYFDTEEGNQAVIDFRAEQFEAFSAKFDGLNNQVDGLLTEIYQAQQSLGDFLIDHDAYFDITDLYEDALMAFTTYQLEKNKKNRSALQDLIEQIEIDVATWQDEHLHLSEPITKERHIRLEQIRVHLHQMAMDSRIKHSMLVSDSTVLKEYIESEDKQYKKIESLSNSIYTRQSFIDEQLQLEHPSLKKTNEFKAECNTLSQAITIWIYESKQYKDSTDFRSVKGLVLGMQAELKEILEHFQNLENKVKGRVEAIGQIDNIYKSFRTTRHNFETYWNKLKEGEKLRKIDKLEFNFQAHTLLDICTNYELLYARLKKKDKHTLFEKHWQKEDKVELWKERAEDVIKKLENPIEQQAKWAKSDYDIILGQYNEISKNGIYDEEVDDTPDKKNDKLKAINNCDLLITKFINEPFDFRDEHIFYYRRVMLERMRPKLEKWRKTFYGGEFRDELKAEILLEDRRLELRWNTVQGLLENKLPDDQSWVDQVAELSDKFIQRREHLLSLIKRWENKNPNSTPFDGIKDKWNEIVIETPQLQIANGNKSVNSKIKEYDDLLIQYEEELTSYITGELTDEDRDSIETAIARLKQETKGGKKRAIKLLKKQSSKSKRKADRIIDKTIGDLTDLVADAYKVIHKVNRTKEAKLFSCFGSYDTFENSNSLRIPEEDLKEMYTVLERLHQQAQTIFDTTGSRAEAKKVFEHIPVNLWPTEFIDDLQLWGKVEKALAIEEIKEIITPKSQEEVTNILQAAQTNNLALNSMEQVMGFISAPIGADGEGRATYWEENVGDDKTLGLVNEVFSNITLANGVSTNVVNLINGVENHNHKAVILSSAKILGQGCAKVAAIAKSDGAKMAAEAAKKAREAATLAGKNEEAIKKAAEDAAKAVNTDVAKGVQAAFQGLAGALTFIVKGIELFDKDPSYDPHATMQSIFDKELKQVVDGYTWAVGSVATVSSVVGIFGDLAAVCGAVSGGITAGINIINIAMSIKEIHQQHIKLLKEGKTRFAAGSADDEILERSIQQSIDRRTQKMVQSSIETSGDILSTIGGGITASGVGAPVGTAFSIVGGALKLGTTIVFTAIEMGQTAEAKKMLKKARIGDRNAQKLIFGKHPFYAKMAIVLSAMGDNEISKDIAIKYCVDLGFTEENFEDQANSVAVIKEAFKYLMDESGQLTFERNQAKDFFKSMSKWYKKFSKKLGFWTTSSSYERLKEVYNADQFREKIAFYINHEHHIGHADIKRQIKFITKVLVKHIDYMEGEVFRMTEELQNAPENFEVLRDEKEVLGEEIKYAQLLLGAVPEKFYA